MDAYYVSAIDPDKPSRRWLMAGPYDTHREALDAVLPISRLAEKHDYRAAWMAWGTAHADIVPGLSGPGVGKMNRLGLI